MLAGFAIHQAAKTLEPQKVHHLDKGQLGRIGSRKKISRNIRAYIVPVELHEKGHEVVVGAALVRQRRFDGGFGLFRQCLRLIQHFAHRVHGRRIVGQFLIYIKEKGQSRVLGKGKNFLAGRVFKINAFTVQFHQAILLILQGWHR